MTNIDIEKLDTDDYAVWRVEKKAFLIIRELWSAVTGEGTLRSGTDEKALAQLALHVRDHHLPTLSKVSTAAAGVSLPGKEHSTAAAAQARAQQPTQGAK